ncbi:MAG: DUF362 domain-containing protein [bacterium]
MSPATLFRVPARSDRTGGLAQKFHRLLATAGLPDLVKKGDLVAVKMHFGEPGNLRYIRPIFPVLLVDFLKELKARPFVTDTAVLYRSERHHAWGYYQVARRNGFTAEVLGCPLLIAGGMGDRSIPVAVPNAMRLSEIGVAPEIYDADVLISLAHATLHMFYPIGATLKNVGMGCVDIPTKMAMHDAPGRKPRHLALQEATCDAVSAVLSKFQNKFLGINLLLDITPDCDCFDKTDLPIVPDLGILAGTDPVALDRASHDLIQAAPGYPGSKLEGTAGMLPGNNKIEPIHSKINAEDYFKITELSGIGAIQYRIIDI